MGTAIDTSAPAPPGSTAQRLFDAGCKFGFFQAVRLLEMLDRRREPVGGVGPANTEVVRFRAHVSMEFPASSIDEIVPSDSGDRPPAMVVNFFGLTGPSGVLPLHYTELLYRLQRDSRRPEQNALREWFDLFNHRLLSLFYRAWGKYRFYIPFERGKQRGEETDAFTQCLWSLMGLGLPASRDRLKVTAAADEPEAPRVLTRIDDLALITYSGLLAHRPRSAIGLESMVQDYFQLPTKVLQFYARWLKFEVESQSRLGIRDGNSRLGADLVLGERVWDAQGRICIRLGPLSYRQFVEFLPDRNLSPERKSFFSLVQLVRLYVGPELDLAVQLVLHAKEIPECRLRSSDAIGSRLGWNTWLTSRPAARDAEDAVFAGEEVYQLN